ncbi:hypothetical protein [Emticicia sp. C21]|uniref:hypothetical protein n=1 Tax=Emticicia sp. C21 TaxID=2302915 RepID=UPI000E34B6C4|nr:hypothetical protein [Emticicia sp. C21]RFS16819.1 hypothetical protein D0T08_09055 [Emticicia sp. C21]
MNKIITTLFLAVFVFACKPKSADIQPIAEIACKKLSYTYLNARTNETLANETYLYDKTGQLIEFKTPFSTIKYEYDAKGNLLKAIGYSKYQGSDIKWSETDYTYNANNQVIRQVSNVLNQPGGVFNKEQELIYEYYANGKMKKKTWFFYDFSKPYYFADYNEKGYEILSHFDGKPYRKTEYNEANLPYKQIQYNLDNSNTVVDLYEYNSQSMVTKSSQFVNGVLDIYSTNEYNSKGQQLNGMQYKGDGTLMSKSILEYTGESYKISNYNGQNILTGYSIVEVQNGLIMKRTSYRDNKLSYYTVYVYDGHKNMIKEESFDDKSALTRRAEWTYQCD